MSHAFKDEGIVLKRLNYQEADRLVTVFTKHHGRLVAVAKGVRKVTSKKRGSLEPASHARFQFVEHHGHYLITEAVLIESHQELQTNLVRVTQTLQLLEIVNAVTGENQELPEIFDHVCGTLALMKGVGAKKPLLIERISQLLYLLGFTPRQLIDEISLQDSLETIIGKALKSKKFLTVSPARVK